MKILLSLIAILLILVGLIVLPMPIPLGALMIALGVVLLSYSSTTVARHIKNYRRRHPKLDNFIRKGQKRLPKSLQHILKRTEP